ncbi:MAG TPA: hypothetical protein PKY59_22525 [Pyrinomonadaceae bacterium]|nr:hypothetical protein [Pyrinomonadaceae bacterium]
MKPKTGFTALGKNIFVHNSKQIGYTQMSCDLPVQICDEQTQKVLGEASLWYFNQPKNSVQDNVNVQPNQKLTLTEDRYVYATFRALSEVFLANRGLDFSKPGVLKSAVELLQGRTVYPNHQFQDIYNWLGVVSNAYWDAKGEKSNGIPGINCEIKIDAFLNYRIASGLMMNPPAVNAMSLTVFFEFEYSHPHMERWKFWEMLGEEVDGDVVRIIVTKILRFFEASLVPVGEDDLAVNHNENAEEDVEDLSAASQELPKNSNLNEEKTMKLTPEMKEKLGIKFDGEDVPESELFKAAELLAGQVVQLSSETNIESLRKQAELADKLLDEKRSEVIRLAKVAELGSDEGELEKVLVDQINEADYERLEGLHKYYEKRAAEKLPNNGRSSLEGSEEVHEAGDIPKAKKNERLPKVKH